MSYNVQESVAAKRAVKKLTRVLLPLWEQAKRQLEKDPRGKDCIKMKGRDAWRISIGDLRAIYSIQDDKLVVLVIDVVPEKTSTRSADAITPTAKARLLLQPDYARQLRLAQTMF